MKLFIQIDFLLKKSIQPQIMKLEKELNETIEKANSMFVNKSMTINDLQKKIRKLKKIKTLKTELHS